MSNFVYKRIKRIIISMRAIRICKTQSTLINIQKICVQLNTATSHTHTATLVHEHEHENEVKIKFSEKFIQQQKTKALFD